MRIIVVAAVVALLLVAVAFRPYHPPGVRADDKPARRRVEYQVVFSAIDHVPERESQVVDGKAREVEHGPAASAEAMTKQFDALAAEGWEYVGPVAPTGRQPPATDLGGALNLFKRARP